MLTTDAPPPTPHQARNKDGDSAFVHVARLPPGSRLELAPYTSLYLAIPPYTSRYLPISPCISPHLPPGMRLEDAPSSFFSGAALGPTGRFGSYAAPQAEGARARGRCGARVRVRALRLLRRAAG